MKGMIDENKLRQDIMEEAFLKRNYLENPQFFEIINEEFDKKIVREEEARKVIFLIANMRNVENLNKGSDNLIVNAISGTGKDHVTESVFSILPEEEKEELVRTTPKVLAYTRNQVYEKDATWKKVTLRLEDASNCVVNDDSFKVFVTANPNKLNIGKTMVKQKVVVIKIEGKPSIIMTMANPDIRDEQLRRFPAMFLDESIDQTKEILKRQATFASNGKTIDYNPDITKALALLKRVRVKIPYAEKLVKIFDNSTQNVIVRTAFPRFLDYIKSSASLYQFQREMDEEGNIIANELDFELGSLCLRKTTSNLLMIPLNELDNKLYDFFKRNWEDAKKQNREIGFTIDSLQENEEIQKLGKSERWIRYRLDFLVSKNFLKRKSITVDKSFKPVYEYSYSKLADFTIPNLEDLGKDLK